MSNRYCEAHNTTVKHIKHKHKCGDLFCQQASASVASQASRQERLPAAAGPATPASGGLIRERDHLLNLYRTIGTLHDAFTELDTHEHVGFNLRTMKPVAVR